MKSIFYKIVVLAIVFTTWSCGNKENTEVVSESEENIDAPIQLSQAQFEQAKMQLGVMEEKPFPTVVKVNGIIDVPPENRAVVSATMGGYIKTTPLLIGDKVRKGQVLVTIENPEFVSLQQEYMEVHGQLSYLKSEYERQQTMLAENITSQKSFLKAESGYRTALASYNGLRKQLTMLNISPTSVESGNITSVATIYAPISGSITKINISKGAYVSPAGSILEIINNDHIHLELAVFEKDIMKIKKGQKIDFKIPEASSATFKAEVYLVGTAMEANRTIKVHGHLENEADNNFLTGMFVEAAIVTDSLSAKALPSEAVLTIDGQAYVLVLNKKEADSYYFIQKEVTVKATYEGYSVIENSAAFKEGEQFLTKGIFNLIGE